MFGLTAAVLWGVSDFLLAKDAKRFSGWVAAFYVNIIASLAYWVAFFIFLQEDTPPLNFEGALYALLGGVTVGCAAILFSKGAQYGPMSTVSPLANSYPIITTAVAITVFGAALTQNQLLGIFMVVIGVMIGLGLLQRPYHKLSIGPMYALGTALGWGVGFALLSKGVSYLGWEVAMLIQTFGVLAIFTALLLVSKNRRHIRAALHKGVLTIPAIWGAGIISSMGLLALHIGMENSVSIGAIVVAVSACSPIITIFLSLRNFKEKMGAAAVGGTFLSIIGVVVLSLG